MVTYKLIKNSQHEYIVCSSLSKQWSYSESQSVNNYNITNYNLQTESFDEWEKFCLEVFKKENEKAAIDVIMSRSMPPESIRAAQLIKEEFPTIKWIASFGDPIANNPYTVYKSLYYKIPITYIRDAILKSLPSNSANVKFPFPGKSHFYSMKSIEEYAINNADILIFPCEEQMNYMLQESDITTGNVIPHSYDYELSGENISNDKIVF